MATTESSSVAKAGLATGIVGTSIAGLLALGNNNGGGLLGGLFGNGNNQQMALAQGAMQQVLAQKDAEIAKMKAEAYANNIGIEVYKASAEMSNKNDTKIQQNLKEAFQEQVAVRERLSASDVEFKYLRGDIDELKNKSIANRNDINALQVQSQATTDAVNALADNMRDRFGAVYGAIEASKNEARGAIALEAERRDNGDKNIYCYVNSTFVPGKLVMPKDSICPPVMERYNSWVAPTDNAPATQPISGTVSIA